MSSISSISLSGMTAAQARLQSSANNVANSLTDGFKRQQVSQQTTAQGGVSTTISQQNQAGPALEQDMVQQLEAKNSFLANLAVFKRGEQMMGSLLNIQA